MGLNEFNAWVSQLHEETMSRERAANSWRAAEHDPGWQALRAKRERLRGR